MTPSEFVALLTPFNVFCFWIFLGFFNILLSHFIRIFLFETKQDFRVKDLFFHDNRLLPSKDQFPTIGAYVLSPLIFLALLMDIFIFFIEAIPFESFFEYKLWDKNKESL